MPIVLFLLCSLSAFELMAMELAGRVLTVSGPLEIEIITETGARQPILLQGIQLDQSRPDASSAIQTRLQGLVAGRFVRLNTQGERQQGRLLGFVDWGGQEVNLTLVEDGLVLPLIGQLDPNRQARYEAAAKRAAEAGKFRTGSEIVPSARFPLPSAPASSPSWKH